jgi:hypothetical protein
LKAVYNTPDGKVYDFFSAASPFIGPEAGFGELAKEGAKEGGWQFLKKATENLNRTPLGNISGLTLGMKETYEAALAPVVTAATVAQVLEYTACHIVF